MLTRCFLLLFCLIGLAAPAEADRHDSKYRITIDPVRPAGPRQTMTCAQPSCQFTVNLNAQAPIDVTTVGGEGGIALYFRQNGMVLPVSGPSYVSSAVFDASRTVKSTLIVQAFDRLDPSVNPYGYWNAGFVPQYKLEDIRKNELEPVEIRTEIYRIRS